MAQNNENKKLNERIMEFRSLSYEEIKKRILDKNEKDLSSEAVARRIKTIRIEMHRLRQETTLTPNEFLAPFTI